MKPGPVIDAVGVSKRYRLAPREAYQSLRESIVKALAAPTRMFSKLVRGGDELTEENSFWAVKDVSFKVNQGDVVGIIGRNGAGKSTMLKMLSRITEPTEGRITLHGRVASLLEVGTGFHPELTGRENIFLNGAILGMRKDEIRRRFDEIVEFAEVAKFLDTAVKHYSSGMYMRLAFSVAAHLDPEILLVDEVLAVGDAAFQRKCLNKMETIGKQGRTIIFISHNMPAVTRLCPQAILLDSGRLVTHGPAAAVVSSYLRSGLGVTAAREWTDRAKAPGNDRVRLRAVRVRTNGEIQETIDIRKPISIELDYEILIGTVVVSNLYLYNEDGTVLFIVHELTPEWRGKERPPGAYRDTVHIPGNFFAEGTVVVRAAISTHVPIVVHVNEGDVVAFHIVDPGTSDTARGDYGGTVPGVVRPMFPWTVTELGSIPSLPQPSVEAATAALDP